MASIIEYEENYGEYEYEYPEVEIQEPEKHTVREEITLIFFNSMLDVIVDKWIPVEDDNYVYIEPCPDSVCCKPYMELDAEDLFESVVLSIDGSMVSIGPKDQVDQFPSCKSIPSKTDAFKKKSKNKSMRKTQSGSKTATKSDRKLKGKKARKPSIISQSLTEEIREEELEPSPSELIWALYPPDENVIIMFKNGNKYEGPISRKQMHGKGVFTWSDGTRYAGDFYKGKITGNGCITFSDLSWYEGGFYDGYRHGAGSIYISGTPKMYSGAWKSGKKDGTGWMLYGPNDWYEGEWKDCFRNGQGFRHYPNKARYFGRWKNGDRHGMGCMVWDNKDIYKGEWEYGLRSGYGEYIWKAFFNKSLSYPIETKYRGTWENGMMHGVGVLHFGMEGGARLAGCWQINKKHGAGIIVCENGTIIESNPLFMNDKPVHLKDSGSIDFGMICPPAGTSTPKKDGEKGSGEHVNSLTTEAQDQSNETSESESSGSMQPIWKQTTTSSLKFFMSHINSKQSWSAMQNAVQENIELNMPTFPEYKMNYKNIQIPLQAGSENINVNFYINNAMAKISSLHEDSFVNTTMDYYLSVRTPQKDCYTPSTFAELENSWSKRTATPITPIDQMPSFEEKWLRNTILLFLPQLRDLYDWYATVACIDICPLTFHPILVRMFLWQLYRDCKLPEKGISLIETDLILDENNDGGVETLHNPFEKIFFWQFLHSLISIAWKLYSDEVEYDGRVSILKLTFTKFLQEDIFPNARHFRGNAFFQFRDVLPLNNVYEWYLSFGEPHTVRTFLNNSCVLRGCSPPIEEMCNPFMGAQHVTFGTNMVTVDQHVSYFIPVKKEILPTAEVEERIYANDEDLFRTSLFLFRKMGAKRVLDCITTICPGVKDDNVIVNIDYPLTFLEFYEIILLLAKDMIAYEEMLRRKANQKMANYIIEELLDRTCEQYNQSQGSKRKKGKKLK